MPHDIIMPQLGLTMTEGSVTTWLKQNGDRVQKGEMLFTVETDKVEMEVESTGSGYLSTVISPGEMVPVGTVIAMLADKPGGMVRSAAAAASVSTASNGAQQTAVAAGAKVQQHPTGETGLRPDGRPASPRARALAKSLGIDINEVPAANATRVVEEDVKRFHESRASLPAQTATKPAPVSLARRITAERTTQSFERAPHFYLGVEVNASNLVGLREELQPAIEARTDTKLTYTDFLLKALAFGLAQHPWANAYWRDESIMPHESIDIGFAAQTESGLLVPVIRRADRGSLSGLARQRHDLSERARAGTLRPDEMSGGSATLSNLGAEGIDWFQAILNPPQSIILAAGSIAKRPMVIDGRIEAGFSLMLTLSVDHRVLDGVAAAKVLSTIKRSLESPVTLLV